MDSGDRGREIQKTDIVAFQCSLFALLHFRKIQKYVKGGQSRHIKKELIIVIKLGKLIEVQENNAFGRAQDFHVNVAIRGNGKTPRK